MSAMSSPTRRRAAEASHDEDTMTSSRAERVPPARRRPTEQGRHNESKKIVGHVASRHAPTPMFSAARRALT